MAAKTEISVRRIVCWMVSRRIRFRDDRAARNAIGDFLHPTKSMIETPATKNALGPALREARLARGWTLPRLADQLRVNGLVCTSKRLSRIEAQQGAIRDFEVFYFCEALGVTHEDLWKRRESLLARRTQK